MILDGVARIKGSAANGRKWGVNGRVRKITRLNLGLGAGMGALLAGATM